MSNRREGQDKILLESQGPRMTMSVLRRIRVSFSDGKAVGADGDSSEIPKSVPWRVFCRRSERFLQ